MVSGSTHQLMSKTRPHFIHTVQLKPMIKAQISGRMICSGVSDVSFASVHREKTCLKKMLIIMIKSQETVVYR